MTPSNVTTQRSIYQGLLFYLHPYILRFSVLLAVHLFPHQNSIKTPLMTIPLKAGVREGQAKKLARVLTQVTLSQVLHRVDVHEKMVSCTAVWKTVKLKC